MILYTLVLVCISIIILEICNRENTQVSADYFASDNLDSLLDCFASDAARHRLNHIEDLDEDYYFEHVAFKHDLWSKEGRDEIDRHYIHLQEERTKRILKEAKEYREGYKFINTEQLEKDIIKAI